MNHANTDLEKGLLNKDDILASTKNTLGNDTETKIVLHRPENERNETEEMEKLHSNDSTTQNFGAKMDAGDLDVWYDPDTIPDITAQVKRKFIKIMIVVGIFIIVELVGGIMANSIAIMGDAFHLLCD